MKSIIIPAAGKGTRMGLLSNHSSKTMLPVCGKPILGYILDSIYKIHNKNEIKVVVIDNPMQSSDIREYLKSHSEYEKSLFVVAQDKANGPLSAIQIGAEFIKDLNTEYLNDVTVWLGDTLIKDSEKLEQFFTDESKVVLGVSEVNDWSRWCMIDDKNNMYDKDSYHHKNTKALIGLYRFNRLTFFYNILKDCNEEQLKYEESSEIKPFLNFLLENTSETYCHWDFSNEWLDCGEIPSYFNAIANLLSSKARDGNSIEYNADLSIIRKQCKKAESEYVWFKKIQSDKNDNLTSKTLIPNVYHLHYSKPKAYAMDFCTGVSLQDLLVYNHIRNDVWKLIIDKILQQHHDMIMMYNYKVGIDDLSYMMRHNIANRIETVSNEFSEDFHDEVYLAALDKLKLCYHDALHENDVRMCEILHGDFHFGNIIYNPFSHSFKLVDPRGIWNNENSTWGVNLYDHAKFYQSIYCGYCFIASDNSISLGKQETINKLIEYTDNKLLSLNYSVSYIKLAKTYSAFLLLSAIPFHNDNKERQKRMLNTSLKLLNL